MKRLLFGILALGFVSCNNDNLQTEDLTNKSENTSPSVFFKRTCPSEELRREALKNNPELRERYNRIEAQTDNFITMGRVLTDGTVEIPVVVNVLYNTNAENISDSRISEQIAVLNSDFSATNSDVSKIPSEFQTVKAGNTKIKFRLANTVRKYTTITSWSTNDNMKKASTGGIDATNPANYLNIWVVSKMPSAQGQTLGYATFPEYAGMWNDGVVIAAPFFGKTGASSPFNLGRTATHEVGHYLNLRHIWGDSRCGNDFVADTPAQTSENVGKPTYPLYNRCNGVKRSVMFMNYMDYVDDAAMFMFSNGQKSRMQSVVASSGARSGLRVL